MEQIRVDPGVLRQVAAELTRLGASVAASRGVAEASVRSAAAGLGPVEQPVLEQWQAARTGLDHLESDYRETARALAELADYFALLDANAVRR